MSKSRHDVQVVASRIDWAIKDGRADALPIFPKPGFTLNRKPRLVILFNSLRLRLPPTNCTAKDRYQRRRGKRWDNRMTIPPSLLNSRWVEITPNAPDYDRLSRLKPDQREKLGVITTNGKMQRRIYEVIADFSHGLRQIEHIKEEYRVEIEKLQRASDVLRRQLADDHAGLGVLDNDTRAQLYLEWDRVWDRLRAIDDIKLERTSRQRQLETYAKLCVFNLLYLEDSLNNFALSVRKNHGYYPARETFLREMCEQLRCFTRVQVKGSCRSAILKIERVIRNLQVGSPEALANLLDEAAHQIGQAARDLDNWLPKEPEMTVLQGARSIAS